jgi:hypothetical protein
VDPRRSPQATLALSGFLVLAGLLASAAPGR